MNGGDPVEPGVNERAPIESQLWKVRTASATGRSGGLSSKANFHPCSWHVGYAQARSRRQQSPRAIVQLRSSRAAAGPPQSSLIS